VLEKVKPSASDKDEALIIIDGKPLSWDFLLSAESVIGILDADPSLLTEKKVVLDIGAGWGRIGYFLNQLNPNLHIVIADIPMTLFVAQRYIESIAPNAISYRYQQTRQLESIDREFLRAKSGISFIGTHSIRNLKAGSIDLTINVASFQEMELKNIRLYMEDINRFSTSCYLMQRKQSDEASFDFYVETAISLCWKTALRRETTFAPNYEEAFFLINTKS
jgi:putative sugar O-methyltransferase